MQIFVQPCCYMMSSSRVQHLFKWQEHGNVTLCMWGDIFLIKPSLIAEHVKHLHPCLAKGPYKSKAGRLHLRNYPHMPIDNRHTDKQLRLVMGVVVGQTAQARALTDGPTHARTDRQMLPSPLSPCFAKAEWLITSGMSNMMLSSFVNCARYRTILASHVVHELRLNSVVNFSLLLSFSLVKACYPSPFRPLTVYFTVNKSSDMQKFCSTSKKAAF